VLVAGHEQEALGVLRSYPSVLSPIAFEPESDLLKAEGLAQVDAFGKALANPALANAMIVVAVHTNAKGSDEFNRSLSSLRAKAIVDQLATRQGLPRTRLMALGFGRMVDPASQMFAPEDRIRVVNLGSTPVRWKEAPEVGEVKDAPPIVAAPAPAKVVKHKATVQKKEVTRKRYASRPKTPSSARSSAQGAGSPVRQPVPQSSFVVCRVGTPGCGPTVMPWSRPAPAQRLTAQPVLLMERGNFGDHDGGGGGGGGSGGARGW
jgi:hypothetical protein